MTAECQCDPSGCSPLTCKCEHHVGANQCSHGQLARSCEVCEMRQRAEAAEAGAAALREALENASPWPTDAVLFKLIEAANILLDAKCYDGDKWELIDMAREVDLRQAPAIRTALATDAGAALLERLRTTEAHLASAEQVAHMGEWARRCIGCSLASRLLRAAQSLHRAWRHEAEMRGMDAMALAERDALRAEAEEVRAVLLSPNPKPARGATIHVARQLVVERDQGLARLSNVAVALREMSPGPHPGPMDAEEYLPLVREELLRLAERGGDAMDECERLKASACRERGLPPQQTCCGCGRWWGGPVCDVCAAKGVTSTKGGG